MDARSTKKYCNRETQRKRSHACDMTFGRSRAGPAYFRPGHKVRQVLQILHMQCPKRMQNNAEKTYPLHRRQKCSEI